MRTLSIKRFRVLGCFAWMFALLVTPAPYVTAENSEVRINSDDGPDVRTVESDDLLARINTFPVSDAEKQKGEVTLKIERDEGPYLLGEPIIVRAFLINGKDEAIRIPWTFLDRGKIQFQIKDDDGETIRPIAHRMNAATGARAITIPSNSKYMHVFDLKYYYAIVDTGMYEVKARYKSEGEYLETKPRGGLTWHPAWEGKLSVDLGEFEVVAPLESVDVEALDRLKVPLRGSERKYRYALMFDVARRENPDFIDEYPMSRYTAYLLFEMAERAMRRDQWRTPERAGRALDLLKRINIDDYPRLFQELVLHRLIVAHIGAKTGEEVVVPLIEEFRERFPESPYRLPDEAREMD